MNKYPKLFPYKFKNAGFILLIPAIFITLIRFYVGEKPEYLKLNVFAFYSSFVETKYFSFIENNISDEICSLLLIGSIILIVFSKEKKEFNDLWQYRFSSLFLAVYANIGFAILSIIFVYGIAFIKLLVLNIYTTPIVYYIIFKLKSRDLIKQIPAEN
jgi:hypothetical protein